MPERETEPERGPEPGIARVIHQSRVEWMDTDGSGHHHNTSIVRFVEAAEAELVRKRGLTGYFGATPRVHYEVDFTAPLWFGQQTTTTLVLEAVGTTSMTFAFEVWGEGTENHPRALAARGRYVVVYVPAGPERRRRPWPVEWRLALGDAPPDADS